MVKKVNFVEFHEEINQGVTFVDFYADWCGPCKMLAPFVEEASEQLTDVKFLKVNVDQEPELSGEFGIMSIPTLLIFKDGKLVAKDMGFKPLNQLISFINSSIISITH